MAIPYEFAQLDKKLEEHKLTTKELLAQAREAEHEAWALEARYA